MTLKDYNEKVRRGYKFAWGWWGVPGGRCGGKVHLAVKVPAGPHRGKWKPVCGAQIHKDAVFQWCRPYHGGEVINWIECKHCEKQARALAAEVNERVAKLLKNPRSMKRRGEDFLFLLEDMES